MLNLIKADFYKLFRTKAFYICGVIAALWASLGIIVLNANIDAEYGISAQLLGYDGLYALTVGVSSAPLLITIMISMFIPSEFSYGTIKNIASRGISRAYIYLSKLVVSVFICFAYTLFSAWVSFTVGSLMWGTGELTRAVYLDIFKMLGLFFVAEIAIQSIFVMTSFMLRSTGRAIGTNIAITMAMPAVIFPLINFAVDQWLKLEKFDAAEYWPETYLSKFLSFEILQSDIVTGLIVCSVALLVSTAIGVFVFYKRDIR